MDFAGLVPATEVLANVAQVISAIAVIISLLYVGYQIKQNTDEIRSANRQQLLSRSMSVTLGFWGSRMLADNHAVEGGRRPLGSRDDASGIYLAYGPIRRTGRLLASQEKRLDDAYWSTRSEMVLSYFETAIALSSN